MSSAPVLVVDDHLDTCELLVRLLRASGYAAKCVTDGRAALDLVDAERPRLIFLDVMMPGMDGFAVLARLRENPRLGAVPVVMYSAMTDPDVTARALAGGAQAFVVKGRLGFGELKRIMDGSAGGTE